MRSRSASTTGASCRVVLVDGVVVAHQLRGGRPHGRDLVGAVAVAGVPGVERQPEPLHPALGGPDLLGPEGVGQVVVLDAGQVPDQPGDRVGLGIDPEGQLPGFQAVEDPVDDLTDPVEGVGEQLGAGHRRLLGGCGSLMAQGGGGVEGGGRVGDDGALGGQVRQGQGHAQPGHHPEQAAEDAQRGRASVRNWATMSRRRARSAAAWSPIMVVRTSESTPSSAITRWT